MIQQSNLEERFSSAFSTFRRSAFRFEALQEYDVEEERQEFQKFLRGDALNSCSADLSDWCSDISRAVAEGKCYQRVRRTELPLTRYTQFEIATGYRFTSAAGEQIRLLEVGSGDIKGFEAVSDFWLFDDLLCFELIYDTKGCFVGVREADATQVDFYVQVKKRLWEASIPLHESEAWRSLYPTVTK